MHRIIPSWVIGAGVVTAMASVGTASTVLYEDNFSGSGQLAGTTPDVTTGSAVWESNSTNFLASGSVTNIDGSALLPFTPAAGTVYEVTATFTNSGGDWLALGFSRFTTGSTSTGSSENLRFSNAMEGYAWLLYGDSVQAFRGNQTNNPITLSNIPTHSKSDPHTIKIVLDTTGASAWSVQYFFDGTLIGGSTTVPTTVPINYVGLSYNGSSGSTASYSYFSVTEAPEPASLVLLSAGASLAAMRRRRQA